MMEEYRGLRRRIFYIITRGRLLWPILLLVYPYAAAQRITHPSDDASVLYTNFDPAMAVVILVLLSSFFFVALFSFYIRHCSDPPATAEVLPSLGTVISRDLSRKRGLDPKVIESFPIFVYSEVKDLKLGRGALECAVCLSEFEDDETLRLLPKCDHVFHPDCIAAWLTCHVTCPVCRAKLTPVSKEQDKLVDPNNESSRSYSISELTNEERGAIAINISEEQITNAETRRSVNSSGGTPATNPSPEIGNSDKFPRSHSTGHSFMQGGVNMERYTLKLPEEVRKQLLESGKPKRTMSLNFILGAEGSSTKNDGSGGGYKSSGWGSSRERSYRTERWVFSVTPPFVSRVGLINTLKVEQGEESSSSQAQV